jgi:hypothetical protein
LAKTFGASKTGIASINAQTLLTGHYFAIIKAGKHYIQKQFIKL